MRLMERMDEAVRVLDREVKRRRRSLLRTIEWSPRARGRSRHPELTVR
jgi:hypothetical protein